MNVGIIGAGNGGQAMAAHLTLKGHKIKLYDIDVKKVDQINQKGGIEITNTIMGFAKVKAYSELAQVIRGAEIIIIVTTAANHEQVATELITYIEEGQTILIMPGYWGSYIFKSIFSKAGIFQKVLLGQTDILIYTCRSIEPGLVDLRSIKNNVKIAAIPSTRNKDLFQKVNPLFPNLIAAENVLETALNNINPISHSPISLFNSARIELGKKFLFYPEGATPSIIKYIEHVDEEKGKLANILGVKHYTILEQLNTYYNLGAKTVFEAIHKNPAYKTGVAPTNLEHRFFYEDFIFGLVPLSQLGKLVGIETPYIDTLINAGSLLTGNDFSSLGFSIADMGISFAKDLE